jgi:putative addiction module component (TIGR02574 family)
MRSRLWWLQWRDALTEINPPILSEMAHALPLPPLGFDDLTLQDKFDYVQSLWDLIAEGADQHPLQDWQARLIDELLEAHRANPATATPAQQVLERLNQRFSQD